MTGSAGVMVRAWVREMVVVVVAMVSMVVTGALLRMVEEDMRILMGKDEVGYAKQLICGGRGTRRRW